MKLARIVVGVDGSPNGTTALEWAAGLAVITGAEVVAVHALGMLEQYSADEPPPGHPHRDEVRKHFESDWCAPLGRVAVPSRLVLRDGSPVSVLLAVADEEAADLVVVGSRGLGENPALLLGSTSAQLARLARQPITVVPHRLDKDS